MWYLRDYDEITYDYYPFPCIEINLDLGIETLYGIMSKVISKGSLFCYHDSEFSIFLTTLHDNQTNITINIYEGEKILAKDNHFLAQIKIKIPPMPSGKPQIEVKFIYDYDDDYMIFVVIEHLSGINTEIKTNNSLSLH